MANTLLTPSIIAKEALMRLRANCVFPALVHRDYSPEFVAKVGDTITVRKPATFQANEFTGSGITVQDANEKGIPVKMDKHLDVSFSVTSSDLALKVQDFGEQFLQPAMEAFSQKVDTYLANRFVDIPFYANVSGTPAIGDFAALGKTLNLNKIPLSNRNLVLDPNTHAKYVVLPEVINAEKSGSTAALRDASIGRILGFDTYMDQNVPTFAKGSLGTAKVQTGVTAGTNSGNFYNTTLTGTLKKGDLFTVAGDATVYTVTADATAAGNVCAVQFYPAASVSWASDAAVTIINGGIANIAFHKNAFCLATRQLELPMGAANSAIVNFEGYAIRVVIDYDIQSKKDIVSLDMLCGTTTLTPEMAVRFIG